MDRFAVGAGSPKAERAETSLSFTLSELAGRAFGSCDCHQCVDDHRSCGREERQHVVHRFATTTFKSRPSGSRDPFSDPLSNPIAVVIANLEGVKRPIAFSVAESVTDSAAKPVTKPVARFFSRRARVMHGSDQRSQHDGHRTRSVCAVDLCRVARHGPQFISEWQHGM